MATEHFNHLSPDEQERLVILAEECAEVQQMVCKILRHGYESTDPTAPPDERISNRVLLSEELGDLLYMIHLVSNVDADREVVDAYCASRAVRMQPYTHHQARKETP